MRREEDENTRYFIDLDLATQRIVRWDYGQRDKLAVEDPTHPTHHRVFITKGQYNKLDAKHSELLDKAAQT
jgi:hypothetical protein